MKITLALVVSAAFAWGCHGAEVSGGGPAGGGHGGGGGEGGAVAVDDHPWSVDIKGSICTGAVTAVAPAADGLYAGTFSGALWHLRGNPAEGALVFDEEPVLDGGWLVAARGVDVYAAGHGLMRIGPDDATELLASSPQTVEHLAPFDGGVAVHESADSLWVWREQSGVDAIEFDANTTFVAVAASTDRIFVRTGPSGAFWSVDTATLVPTLLASDELVPSALWGLAVDDAGTLFGIATPSFYPPGFLANAYEGELWKSADGAAWTKLDVPEGFEPAYVAASGPFVAVTTADASRVLLSADHGATFFEEIIDAKSSGEGLFVGTVDVTPGGTVAVGAWCSRLFHRRAPLTETP